MSPESNAEACAMGTNPCHPDTDGDGWDEMDESRVYLDNETVRIKIRVYPKVSDLSSITTIWGDNVQIRTSGTKPQGANILFAADNWASGTSDYSEKFAWM